MKVRTMTLFIEQNTVISARKFANEMKLYMLVPFNVVLLWITAHVGEMHLFAFVPDGLFGYIPFSVFITALSQIVTVAGSIALLFYTRHKFLHDIKIKKLDAEIKAAQLEEIKRRANLSARDADANIL